MTQTLPQQPALIQTIELTSWSDLSAAITRAMGPAAGSAIDQKVNALLAFMQWPGHAVLHEGFLFLSCSALVITSTPQVIAQIQAANRTGRL